MPFPISEFLHDESNQLQVWDFNSDPDFGIQQLIQELQAFQPVVLGINDRQSTNGLVLERLIKQMFPRALVFFSPHAMTAEELMNKANQAGFKLRHQTRPMAGKIRFRASWELAELFQTQDSAARSAALEKAQQLIKQYQLDDWLHYLPQAAFRQVLETLELLEDCFGASHQVWQNGHLRILDVGAGRWAYASALYHFFAYAHSETARQVFLTGVEIDPYRVDNDGYSCVDHALSYVDPIASVCRYLSQSIFDYQPQQPYDVVTLFKPCLNRQEHLQSGMPLEFFHPQKLLQQAASSASATGSILITQQDALGVEHLNHDLRSLHWVPRVHGVFNSELLPDQSCFVSVTEK